MSLKKYAAILVAALAISAIVASSASAAVTTGAVKWYTGASGTTEVTSATAINATIGESALGKKFLLKSKVSGQTLELTATGITCNSCTIENKEITGKAGKVASGKGSFTFSGVSVMTPAECTTTATIATKPLVVHADLMIGERAFQRFIPEAGETATFAQVTLSGCSIAGTYNVKGSVYSEAQNKTNVFAGSQTNKFTPAINTEAGGALKLGEEPAEFTGNGVFTLGAPNEGVAFGVK